MFFVSQMKEDVRKQQPCLQTLSTVCMWHREGQWTGITFDLIINTLNQLMWKGWVYHFLIFRDERWCEDECLCLFCVSSWAMAGCKSGSERVLFKFVQSVLMWMPCILLWVSLNKQAAPPILQNITVYDDVSHISPCQWQKLGNQLSSNSFSSFRKWYDNG